MGQSKPTIALLINGPLKGKQVAIAHIVPHLEFADFDKSKLNLFEREDINIRNDIRKISYRPYRQITDDMVAYVHEP